MPAPAQACSHPLAPKHCTEVYTLEDYPVAGHHRRLPTPTPTPPKSHIQLLLPAFRTSTAHLLAAHDSFILASALRMYRTIPEHQRHDGLQGDFVRSHAGFPNPHSAPSNEGQAGTLPTPL